jgi:hypothetical protein
MTFTWTPEAIAQAAALYGKGTHSAAQIGELLGTSKGSVIGKMSRAGIVAVRATCDAPPKPSVERKGPAKRPPVKAEKPVQRPQRKWGRNRADEVAEFRELTGEKQRQVPIFDPDDFARHARLWAHPLDCPTAPHGAIAYAPPGTKQRVGYRRCGGLGDVYFFAPRFCASSARSTRIRMASDRLGMRNWLRRHSSTRLIHDAGATICTRSVSVSSSFGGIAGSGSDFH